MSDVEKIISDIIFSTSDIVFPTSILIFAVFGKKERFGYFDNCRGVLHTPCMPPHKPPFEPQRQTSQINATVSQIGAIQGVCNTPLRRCNVLINRYLLSAFVQRRTMRFMNSQPPNTCKSIPGSPMRKSCTAALNEPVITHSPKVPIP